MINQTKFENICKENNMFPVPEYDFIIISREAILAKVDSETGDTSQIKPINYTKKGVPKYELTNYKGEKSIIKLDRLMMNTFVGIFNAEIIHRVDEEDCSIDNLRYIIESTSYIDNDNLSINNTLFKRIYVKEKSIRTEYFISNNGVIYSEKSKNFKIPSFQYNYYKRCQFNYVENTYNKSSLFGLHRVVYETWYNKILSQDIPINHKNGRKNDNYYLNLEESSALENLHHAMENNLRYAKWTDETVSEVCELLETNKYKPSEIAEKLGYTAEKDIKSVKWLIKAINQRNTWSHVSQKYDLSKYQSTSHEKRIPDEIVHKVCKLYVEGLSRSEIKERTGMSQSWINAVIRGNERADISNLYPIDKISIRRNTDLSLFPKIGEDITNGLSIKETANKYNIDRQIVDKFVSRKIYPEIGLNFDFESKFPNKKYFVNKK